MPPKKKQKISNERQQRDHPKVEQWKAIATLASNITKYVQQQHQYTALLRQIAQLTDMKLLILIILGFRQTLLMIPKRLKILSNI